ncbi:hypothetical protein BD410DRAFT_800215 [Rickenella mellea]|uniref:F-box domain-containing protein n=1 Tax=Rickenella mellea TaxID=50990 RepID=A0A4Y7QK07_9AGAM|nr:hypothetical protein BD410DRAFT_800215 [Rickenella mellea]
MPPLPSEIWRDIIRFATSIPVYFETYPDPNDWPNTCIPDGYMASIKTKKFLSLVSHQFNRITSEFFCEIIYLEEPIQARRLADILDDLAKIQDCYPGNWTRHLFIRVSITSVATHLIRILRHCSRLVGFSWVWHGSWQEGNWDSEQTKMLAAIPSGVQYLDSNGMIVRKSAANTFFTGLSLSLIAMRISKPLVDQTGLVEVPLPHLTHLDLSYLRPEWFASIQNWGLRSLTSLSVSHVQINSPFYRLLKAVGTSLASLRFGAGIASDNSFSDIFTLLPVLEKLTYQFHDNLIRAWSDIHHHSTLCHVTCNVRNIPIATDYYLIREDLWRVVVDHFTDIDRQRFPALTMWSYVGCENCRIFQ